MKIYNANGFALKIKTHKLNEGSSICLSFDHDPEGYAFWASLNEAKILRRELDRLIKKLENNK